MTKHNDNTGPSLFDLPGTVPYTPPASTVKPSAPPARPAARSAAPPSPAPIPAAKPEKPAKSDTAPRVYSVSQLTTMVRLVIEAHVPPKLAVVGEISDIKCHNSGHCYFTIKDQGSQLPCVMWAGSFKKLKFTPVSGMAVVLTGHLEVYQPAGKYQFIADSMAPEGKGALQLAFEQMVRTLEAQGLFAQQHKKTLPPYPMRIAVVTSESGAALHDIASSMAHRWPVAKLLLYPVPVQGEGAAPQIAAAIRDINRRQAKLKIDVMIVGRGGGSLEDLWAFNEEVVARAIYDSKIPVISAVGHEVDTTISDLVADARAATPTKAAVIACPDILEVAARLDALGHRLSSFARRRLESADQNLQTILASSVFKNPLGPVLACSQTLDDKSDALTDALQARLNQARQAVQAGYEKIVKIEPHRLIGTRRLELGNFESRMSAAIGSGLRNASVSLEKLDSRSSAAVTSAVNRATLSLTAHENRLAALNPKSVLGRGYSIVRNSRTGSVVTAPAGVEIGDTVITEFSGENFIESLVTAKQNMEPDSGKTGN